MTANPHSPDHDSDLCTDLGQEHSFTKHRDNVHWLCVKCGHMRPIAGPKDVQSQVIDDIHARRVHGIEEYGQAVFPHNGRDALLDAYEEALDLAIYLKQAMLERDATRREG